MSSGTTVATSELLDNPDPLLDRNQARVYANLTDRTSRLLFERRVFPTVKIGRRVLVRRSDLDAYIASCTRPAVTQ